MRAFNEQAQSDEIGRDIGFDMYRIGIPIEEMESFSSVQEGFQTAQIQNTTKIARPTIFERKLIQIRMRAYRKGIPVEITKEDLAAAFDECRGLCPVTGRAMTVAQISDTDWSVDRLDNEAGYLPDNIVVMSSMANQAKGDLSLHDIILYCMGGEISSDSASRFSRKPRLFWRRLLSAYYKKMPSHYFGRVVAELCEDHVQRFAILTALNVHLFQIVSGPKLHEVERLWRSCPFLSTYLKDGTIKTTEIGKLRKSALNTIRSSGLAIQNVDNDDVFQMTAKFVLAARSVDTVRKLVNRWELEIDTDENRRTLMLAVLIEDSEPE